FSSSISNVRLPSLISALFFFTDPATTEIFTLSLHDALPISVVAALASRVAPDGAELAERAIAGWVAALPAARSSRDVMTGDAGRSEEHTSELQSLTNLVCRLLLEKKKIERSQYLSTSCRLPN